MFKSLKSLFLAIALSTALAPVAAADNFGIAFSKKIKHGSIAFRYSTGPVWAPGYRMQCSTRVWVPGRYEIRCESVWVEGCTKAVWVDPVFEVRYVSCGRSFQVCVSGGHYQVVTGPGHYVTREIQVWVPAHWENT